MPQHKLEGGMSAKKCADCEAPASVCVSRRWLEPKKWSLDTDLSTEHPDTWRRKEIVMLRRVGDRLLCRFCRPLINLLPEDYDLLSKP